jgi:adenosylcobinamide-phosphate synthase
MERFLRRRFPATKEGELAAGRIIAVVLPAAVFALAFAACRVCLLLHPILYFCLEAFWGYQALAARSLAGEAEKVRKSLTGEAEKESSSMEGESCRRKDRLSSARRQVARIVGRDTEKLDEAGIIRACVETVAENSSDGVTAPLFYLLLGGAPLALAYKAVNTMDSMIGYRNDRYLFFGRAAARLDDCFNFLPSRITALLWIVAAALVPFADAGQAWRIFRRDRKKHASPNAAQTESACAGALHIRLAGPASYFGRRMEKPWIGDDDKPVEPEDIRRSVWLMWISSALALAIGIAVRVLLRKMTFHV